MSGLDRLLGMESPPMAPDARVGLLCHHASVTRNGIHAVEALGSLRFGAIRCLFTPEHGFSGTAAAGEMVPHSTVAGSEIPIHSLYGETRSPDVEWLRDLDVVVSDLMDLGVRCYTYASTLMEMMRACTRARVPLVVLDRWTPLQGITDGPGLDADCSSFVGQVPLPLVFGKSQGALASWLQQTLSEFADLQLTVIRTQDKEPPPWIPPSPAIVSPDSARCYPITVWSEAIPQVWVDRGGINSFQVWAMPDLPAIDPDLLGGFGFGIEPGNFDTPEGCWPGFKFTVEQPSVIRPVSQAHALLHALCKTLGPDRLFKAPGARPEFFDLLAGTRSWREGLIAGEPPDF